jgi:hypothetical protein
MEKIAWHNGYNIDPRLGFGQGDQIRRTFAYWAIVNSGQISKNSKGAQIFGLPLFTVKLMHYF